jgi:hypothetical protein
MPSQRHRRLDRCSAVDDRRKEPVPETVKVRHAYLTQSAIRIAARGIFAVTLDKLPWRERPLGT